MAETFHSKVVGVTKDNDDGQNRQEIIQRELEDGDLLFLDREPDNPYDSNAIAVVTSDFEKKIGYISSDLASRLAPQMDRGASIDCYVAEITGGGPGQSYGVNIRLTVNNPVKTISTTLPSYKRKLTLKQRWLALPKKTRTWLIVIGVIIILTICGALTSCTPQVQEVVVVHTQEVLVTQIVEVTREVVVTATPLPPTPTSTFQKWTLEDAGEAIIGAGLEFDEHYVMTKDDYGLAPMNAVEAWRFIIPSLCSTCGGRIYSFDDPTKLAAMKDYYDKLGEASAMFFSWTFAKDNILIQISGDLPEAKALLYQQALESIN